MWLQQLCCKAVDVVSWWLRAFKVQQCEFTNWLRMSGALDSCEKVSLTPWCYCTVYFAMFIFILLFSKMVMLVHPFISSHLDYCSALWSCLSKSSINNLLKLQSAKNAAVRLLSQSKILSYHSIVKVSALASVQNLHSFFYGLRRRGSHLYVSGLLDTYSSNQILRTPEIETFWWFYLPLWKLRGDCGFQTFWN